MAVARLVAQRTGLSLTVIKNCRNMNEHSVQNHLQGINDKKITSHYNSSVVRICHGAF